MEALPNRQVEYNIGDIIEWLHPFNGSYSPVSIITDIFREYDGSLHYMVESYEAQEKKTLKESYPKHLLDHMLYPIVGDRMAIHYPVVK
jgi:hypothetical protein